MDLNIRESLAEYELAEDMLDIYKNPTVSGMRELAFALSKSIPVLGTVFDETVLGILENHQKAKQQQLLEAIIHNADLLSSQRVHAIPFLMEFARTQQAVLRLANEKKVQFICNLFVNYFVKEEHEDVDEYDEFLLHLEQLSYRELDLLVHLYEYQREEAKRQNMEELTTSAEVFEKLRIYAEKEYGLSRGELIGLMTSVTKSGFCKEETGAFLNNTGGKFMVTGYFEKFLRYVRERD